MGSRIDDDGEEMTKEEQLSAVAYSVEHTWVAAQKIAAFVAGGLPEEGEMVEEARRCADSIDRLRSLVRAKNPPPWNFVEESDGVH